MKVSKRPVRKAYSKKVQNLPLLLGQTCLFVPIVDFFLFAV